MGKKSRTVLAVAAVGICLLAVLIVAGCGLCKVNTVVYTTSSGLLSGKGYRYFVTPLFQFKAGWSEEDRKDMQNRTSSSLQRAILAVSAVDPEVYRNPYTAPDRLVFAMDGQIYYYRENVFDGFFSLDVATQTITKHDFSEYSK